MKICLPLPVSLIICISAINDWDSDMLFLLLICNAEFSSVSWIFEFLTDSSSIWQLPSSDLQIYSSFSKLKVIECNKSNLIMACFLGHPTILAIYLFLYLPYYLLTSFSRNLQLIFEHIFCFDKNLVFFSNFFHSRFEWFVLAYFIFINLYFCLKKMNFLSAFSLNI